MKNAVFAWCLLVLVAIPLIFPFLGKGYFPTHDGEWAIIRLAEMHREIKDLQLPPRWAGYLNHGFGYPLFLFTYPFPYYLGEIFYLLGFGLVGSIKLLFIISIIGSAITMFLLANKIWGERGGLLATILYLYAPYRLLNLYVRGSVGESLAFVFFPLLFLLFQKVVETNYKNYVAATVIILSLFILTHNAMVVLFLPFLFTWTCYLLTQKNINKAYSAVKRVILIFIISFAVSAYFWLPAVIEKQFLKLSQIPLTDKSIYFINFKELLMPNIGIYSPKNTTFFQLGLVHIFIVLIGLIFAFFTKRILRQNISLVVFFLISLIFSIFMLSSYSFYLWKLPLLKEIDFPWRMLGVSIFLISLLGGILGNILESINTKIIPIVFGIIIVSIVFSNLVSVATPLKEIKSDDYYATNDATTTSADELMPVWVTDKPTNRPASKIELDTLNSLVSDITEKSDRISFNINSVSDTSVIVNTVYFPGWKVYLNNQNELPVQLTKQTGLISFLVPKGNNQVNVLFTKTRVRQLADILTVIGFISFVVLWRYSKNYFH